MRSTLPVITSERLAEQAGVTYRVIDYWCRMGVLDAVGSTTPGTGSVRRFPRHEARVASVLARLNELGATVETLRAVGPMLRAMPAEEWHGELLVAKSGVCARLRRGEPVTFGEACWVVNLDLCAMRAA